MTVNPGGFEKTPEKNSTPVFKKPQLIMFDLDGTLIDSVPDMAWCIDQMLGKLKFAPQGEDMIRLWVGNGIEKLISRSIHWSSGVEPNSVQMEKAIRIFNSLYLGHFVVHTRIYDGVSEFFDFLKSKGIHTGCVTNKAERFTFPLLETLGLSHYFEMVICGDTLARMKPDPLPLITAAKNFSVLPASSLMVGDSVVDVKAARNAGFGIVCMSYGYNHGEDISLSRPDAVIDSMTELESIIEW
jgi:phosphoglycolate phosphatase